MRKRKVSKEDKSIYIAGTMFLTLATALFITGMFIPKALGVALLTALVTYVFFDQCYYKIKDWMLSANSKQSETFNKIYVLKIYN